MEEVQFSEVETAGGAEVVVKQNQECQEKEDDTMMPIYYLLESI